VPSNLVFTARSSSGAFPAVQAGGAGSLSTAQEEPDLRDRGRAIEEVALSGDFPRVVTPENTMTAEEESVCHQLVQALDFRWKWLFRPAVQPHHDQVRRTAQRALSRSRMATRASMIGLLPRVLA
jgi:hypothetical protein